MAQDVGVYRKALRHPSFRWLLLAGAQSAAGDFLYNVALFVVVFDRTHSAGWVSATAVLIRVPRVVLPPFAGLLADRVERRNLMVVLDVARAAVMSIVAVLVVAKAPIAAIVGLAVLAASLATPYSPAQVGLLPSIIPEEDLAAANAVSGSLGALALVVGPAIGGLLVVVGSPSVAFAINAGTFVVSALCVLRVPRAPVDTETVTDEVPNSVLSGVRALLSDPKVVVIASGLVATCFAIGASGVVFVLLSDERLGTGAHGYGYLLAALGTGGVLATLQVDRMAAVRRLAILVLIALLVVGGSFSLLSTTHTLVVALLITAFFGGAYELLEVLSMTLMQRCLPSSVLGAASGALDAVTFGAVLLGAAVMGPVHNAFGLTTAILVAAVPALAAAAVTTVTAPRLDRRSAEDLEVLAPRIALLEAVDVLRGASRASLERLAAEATEEQMPAGTAIVSKGQPADDFFVMELGTAEVRTAVRRGSGAELGTLGPGDSFGEIGLLERRPRTATVRAITDSVVLRVPGETFTEVVTAAPRLRDAFGAVVTTRLARSRELERRR